MSFQTPFTPPELVRTLSAASNQREARAAIERWLGVPERRSGGRPRPPAAAPETIGIWRRTSLDGKVTYARDTSLEDPNFWGPAERIGPKTGTRIVLLGESVARGVFLDPLFNCASALRAYLDALCGPGTVEIVDLARCGLTAPRLVQMVEQCAALEPDMLVIFAGNNWALDPTSLDDETIARVLERGGSWTDVGSCFRDALRRDVATLMSAVARAASVPAERILFAIPASNVRDTVANSELHDPLQATSEFLCAQQALATAEALLARKMFAEANAAAQRVIELDPVLSARALQICGLCALALGDKARAVQRFGEMVDAYLYLPLPRLLPCGPAVSSAIRDAARSEGIPIVDIGQVLLDANDGVPPGRDLFLDHVHMTARGIQIAMAAIAEQLLPVLNARATPWRTILEIPVDVDPLAMAQGHCIAALMHFGPEQRDVAAHHATEAIRHASDIAIVMHSMMRTMLSQTSETYHDAYTRLVEALARFPGIRMVLYRIPVASAESIYVELVRVLAAAAEAVMPGTVNECEWLLRQSVLREGRPTGLMRYVLRHEAPVSWRGTQRTYVRSFNGQTEFRLRSGAPRDLLLAITARQGRGRPRDPTATLLVNGSVVHRWEVTARWSTSTCTVPAALLREDVNDLRIVWPDPSLARSDRLTDLVEIFRAGCADGTGFVGELFPVYGDVYSLDARIAPVQSVSVTSVEEVTLSRQSIV